ncbi:MAG: MASE1 domain-containing protein [Betaproteobacteria bacterium]|nr:MASE1 domain-containing protein [Betaproteobacteria bacterium]
MEGLLAQSRPHQPASVDDPPWRWLRSVGLAVAVGLAYFIAAHLGVGLVFKPEGVAVFWPAAGISTGCLIALGRRAQAPLAAGVIAATVVVHLLIDDPLWAGVAWGVCNAAEALITAGLIQLYFGVDFTLDKLLQVLGLLAAAIIGTAVSGIGGAVVYRLVAGPSATMLTSWRHWFASDAIGIFIVAPLVIGVAAAIRQPLPRREVIEGAVALAVLAVMTGIVILLPPRLWVTVLPIAALFPILLWVTARHRPVYTAAAVFLVSIGFVSTAVYGVGHFGDTRIQFADRILQAQSAILFVALGAFVMAALFAERRQSEARLTRSNLMLERAQEDKLMNMQAMAASISHEIRQPLAAVTANAAAARELITHTPPDLAEAESALADLVIDGNRIVEILNNLRALFGKAPRPYENIDVNEVVLGGLRILRSELNDHGVKANVELASDLPQVLGDRGQLQEVIINLVHNAVEAMDAVKEGDRVLNLKTRHDGDGAIIVAVEDSGPGIDPEFFDNIFDAFVTTKPQGTGLGLAICRTIIDGHGGRLSAASVGKGGARFQLELPLKPEGIEAPV